MVRRQTSTCVAVVVKIETFTNEPQLSESAYALRTLLNTEHKSADVLSLEWKTLDMWRVQSQTQLYLHFIVFSSILLRFLLFEFFRWYSAMCVCFRFSFFSIRVSSLPFSHSLLFVAFVRQYISSSPSSARASVPSVTRRFHLFALSSIQLNKRNAVVYWWNLKLQFASGHKSHN